MHISPTEEQACTMQSLKGLQAFNWPPVAQGWGVRWPWVRCSVPDDASTMYGAAHTSHQAWFYNRRMRDAVARFNPSKLSNKRPGCP